MQVQCTLCDKTENIESNSFEAKRLRNHGKHMYLCEACYERIKTKTLERHNTGNFKLFREKKKVKDFL